MDADSFVIQLAASAPSMVDLKECGFADEQAREFLRSYQCVKRDGPLSEPQGVDPVLELLRNWDVGRLEIGMVRFPGTNSDRSEEIVIGRVEADPLVLLPHRGEFVVHELGTKGHLLWRVARNGSALLRALVIAAKFFGQRASGTIDLDDDQRARSVALECAVAAGGGEFADFYTMLLGAG